MKTVNKKYELVPIGDLVEHPQNPRRGDMESIVDSVATNNVYGAAIVQRSTRHILAGNHRVRGYVPSGRDWYAYSTRRLRENPSVAKHIMRAMFRRQPL